LVSGFFEVRSCSLRTCLLGLVGSECESEAEPDDVGLAQAIEKAHGIQCEWLLYGTGQMFSRAELAASRHRQATVNGAEELQNAQVYVPVLSSVISNGAGTDLLDCLGEVEARTFDRRWLEEAFLVNAHDLCLFQVRGDSMAPTFADGELVFVDASTYQAPLIDGIWLLEFGNMPRVKRVQQLGSNSFQATNDNPLYEAMVLAEGVKALGRVVGGFPKRC